MSHFTETKTYYGRAGFVKAVSLGLQHFENRTLLQLHSCGLYKSSLNSFFEKRLQAPASDNRR